MYTVSQLVDVLGLETDNQVRNRLNALRDQLLGHLRRGPNNQLLVTETGLELLRSLQALCETGYTLREAAARVRYDEEQTARNFVTPTDQSHPNVAKEDQGSLSADATAVLLKHLSEQVRALEARVAALEAQNLTQAGHRPWWERWR